MGLRIKELLREKGLTQAELAEKLNINRASLHEQIKGNPTIETLQKWAEALGVDISELFELKSEHKSKQTTVVCPHCGKSIKIEKAE